MNLWTCVLFNPSIFVVDIIELQIGQAEIFSIASLKCFMHLICRGLAHLGMIVAWRTYEDGGHWVNEPQGVNHIVAFLKKAFLL